MEGLKDGWYSEVSAFSPGQAMSLEVDKVLHHEKSKFQDILFFKSKNWGNVLVLDGAIQATERDEFAYQEMIAHIPLFSHPNPEKVLVIGGGDGGVLREVVKHPSVESVTLCEIDGKVVEFSKKFLPHMASGFSDPRVNVIVGDGLAFMRDKKGEYDVIITDSSDPVGPAEGLFGRNYYQLVKEALKQNGIACSQAESMWLHLDTIKTMVSFCKEIFPHVEYAWSSVPTYPAGSIGYLIVGLDKPSKKPSRNITIKENMVLRYYNEESHIAAFALPQFAKEALSL